MNLGNGEIPPGSAYPMSSRFPSKDVLPVFLGLVYCSYLFLEGRQLIYSASPEFISLLKCRQSKTSRVNYPEKLISHLALLQILHSLTIRVNE